MSENVWLTVAELATAAHRQRRSIRRMIADGAFGGAVRQDADGEWRVAVEAAHAAGLRIRDVDDGPGHETAVTATAGVPSSTPDPGDVEDLHRRLAEAERRTGAAEAEARALRAVLSRCEAAAGALVEALGANWADKPTDPQKGTRAAGRRETHAASNNLNGNEAATRTDSSTLLQELPL